MFKYASLVFGTWHHSESINYCEYPSESLKHFGFNHVPQGASAVKSFPLGAVKALFMQA